jgi:hypothetical protein
MFGELTALAKQFHLGVLASGDFRADEGLSNEA